MALTVVPPAACLPDVLPSERLGAGGRPVPALRDQLRRIDGRRNAITVAGAWLQSMGVVAAALVVDRWWGYVLGFVLVGRGFVLLSILAHEAAHRLLFRSRAANDGVVGCWPTRRCCPSTSTAGSTWRTTATSSGPTSPISGSTAGTRSRPRRCGAS